MRVWIVSRAGYVARLAHDFVDGLAAGIVAVWIFPRLINGAGATIVFGILVLLLH